MTLATWSANFVRIATPTLGRFEIPKMDAGDFKSGPKFNARATICGMLPGLWTRRHSAVAVGCGSEDAAGAVLAGDAAAAAAAFFEMAILAACASTAADVRRRGVDGFSAGASGVKLDTPACRSSVEGQLGTEQGINGSFEKTGELAQQQRGPSSESFLVGGGA